MHESKILDAIETAIAAEERAQPEPLPIDKWLASSCLQKSIRHGKVEQAERAAVTLLEHDRMNFWRRLHVIALEDIGVASTDAMMDVLTATTATAWRKRQGELRVALHLIRRLCEATKTRAADELFLQVERAGNLAPVRERFAIADDALLVDRMMDEQCPLAERALACVYLAGTKKYPSELMPKRDGSPEAVKKVLRSLNAPVDLIESCIGVMNKTQYPLALFTPLIWQVVHRQGEQLKVRHEPLLASPDVGGIPVYAADVYTRVGQSCFRQLRHAVPEFKQFTVRQIGVGLFYLEGGKLDKVLTSPFLEELSQAGEAADAEGVGLSPHQYRHLRECLAQHMDLLTDIRRDKLHCYLSGAEA